MAVRSHSPAHRRRGATGRAGLGLVVFHASTDVKRHLGALIRARSVSLTCYPQKTIPIRRPAGGVNAVLWELAPGRRPNWRRLNTLARGTPVLSYSSAVGDDIRARSAEMGFAGHLSAPLRVADVRHHVAVASPADLTTRLQQSQATLRRSLRRVEVFREMHRAVNASVDPFEVADVLVAKASTWLPAPSWVLVGRDGSGAPVLIAERGLSARVETAVCQMGGWVLDHAREFGSASLRDEPLTRGAPDVAAVAFPLKRRGRTVGALVGVDRAPSLDVPRLSVTTLTAIQDLLEPAAVALDNAWRLLRAEELSVTDDLTQLYNLRYLTQALRREAKRQMRSFRPLSLLFVDLDGFKSVNDQHGHLHGSRALVEVARIIRDCSRETDITARYGGDEFAIVLPDTGTTGAMALARRLCEQIREHRFLQAEGLDVRLTASAGVATLPDTATTVEELIQSADDAMYHVKATGKDGIQLSGAASREGVSA